MTHDAEERAYIRHELRELRAITEANAKATADLVQAWNTARGLVKFVKVLGSLATAVAAVWALFKFGSTIK